MTKNGKRNVLIGAVSAACVAMVCVISSQFINAESSRIISRDSSGTDKVSAAISTTAPIIAEDINAETTAPAETSDTTEAVDDDSGVITETPTVTTAEYTTKNVIVIDQSFSEATRPETAPPVPEVSDSAMLTNAEIQPTYEPEETTVTTTTPQASVPKNGETSGNMIYADGFGWVVNEGGGGEGSTNDEMYCNGNKIGYFG